MKEFHIIFIALARWDGTYSSSAYSIAKEWSKKHNLFYIENPITIKQFLINFTKRNIRIRWKALLFGKYIFNSNHEFNLITVTPQIILSINWINNSWLYDKLNKLNNYIFFKAVKKTIKRYSLSNYIIFNSFNPFYQPFNRGFNPVLNIYQSVDNISQSTYIKKHGTKLEITYVKKADFTITTSQELQRKLRNFSKEVHLLTNAADYNLFRKAYFEDLERPKDLLEVDVPIISYVGNICNRLNYSLLLRIASENKDKKLVLIGPESVKNGTLELLKHHENVIFLGQKDISQLPAYLKYSNCAIIPFLVNELTQSIYPLKINEYLSSGLPVITTKFSKDLLEFRDVIDIAENDDSFLRLINTALKEDTIKMREKRVTFASKNSWCVRVKELEKIVSHYIDEKKVKK